MADAAWSPDDSSFRSPFWRAIWRSEAVFPGMKTITRLAGDSFHGLRARGLAVLVCDGADPRAVTLFACLAG